MLGVRLQSSGRATSILLLFGWLVWFGVMGGKVLFPLIFRGKSITKRSQGRDSSLQAETKVETLDGCYLFYDLLSLF